MARPPPLSPHPPPPIRKRRRRQPRPPPEAEEVILPPPGRTAAPGREARAGPAPTPQPPAPAGTTMDKQTRANTPGLTRTAPGDSKRSRTGAVWGPRPPWSERRQGHPLCCLPREGRGTDRGKATPRPTGPPWPHSREERRTGRPPHPTPPHSPAQERPRCADPAHGERRAPSQVGGKQDRAAPPPKKKPNGTRDRGRTGVGARTACNGPTSAQHRDRARCARHTNQGWGGGGGRTRRERERTQAQRARGEDQKGNRTEPAERRDRMEWRTSERG